MSSPARSDAASSAERLILVNPGDRRVGVGDKLEAHRRGLLHRAFSIFLTDGLGRTLLQRRHSGKYHSGGLWANSCCGHPRPGERTSVAARRRLREELGVDVPLHRVLRTSYRARVSDDMEENEIVYLFVGRLLTAPCPDPGEVDELRWTPLDALLAEARKTPSHYAPWLRIYLESHAAELRAALSGAPFKRVAA